MRLPRHFVGSFLLIISFACSWRLVTQDAAETLLASGPMAASADISQTALIKESAVVTEATDDLQYGAPPPAVSGGQSAAECNCPACQAKKAAALKKAVASAYAPLFHNNNFAYINNPAYNDWYPGDYFKQMPFGDCLTVDMGGQFRSRYHHEQNMFPFGLTGHDNDFLLLRTRLRDLVVQNRDCCFG
jgi:hypothetical protein